MQSNVNRANDSRYSRSHYFIWSVTNFWLLRDLKNLLTGTTSSHQCSQQSKTLSLDITKPYNLLLSENTSKFYIWKTKKVTSKKQQSILVIQNCFIYLFHIVPKRTRGRGGGYFWEFLVGVCRLVLQILTDDHKLISGPKCHFSHPFSREG